VDIRYFYQNTKPSYKHEAVITAYANAISNIIELPPLLEVCLYNLGESVYGGIDLFRINRIGINYTLPYDSVPKVLAHELIHVHQKFKGTLKITPNNKCYWHGIFITSKSPDDMTNEEYMNLPWEIDAYHRQQQVLSEAITYLTNNSK